MVGKKLGERFSRGRRINGFGDDAIQRAVYYVISNDDVIGNIKSLGEDYIKMDG